MYTESVPFATVEALIDCTANAREIAAKETKSVVSVTGMEPSDNEEVRSRLEYITVYLDLQLLFVPQNIRRIRPRGSAGLPAYGQQRQP